MSSVLLSSQVRVQPGLLLGPQHFIAPSQVHAWQWQLHGPESDVRPSTRMCTVAVTWSRSEDSGGGAARPEVVISVFQRLSFKVKACSRGIFIEVQCASFFLRTNKILLILPNLFPMIALLSFVPLPYICHLDLPAFLSLKVEACS